jgi:hypothetical protein
MRPDKARDPVAGPDSGPEPPFPIRLSGPVIKGFGRGSKEVSYFCLIGVVVLHCTVWFGLDFDLLIGFPDCCCLPGPSCLLVV